jgi:hypothetical protein
MSRPLPRPRSALRASASLLSCAGPQSGLLANASPLPSGPVRDTMSTELSFAEETGCVRAVDAQTGLYLPCKR